MPPSATAATHLILVCCHAIYLGGPTKGVAENEWLLAPFQSAETPTFTEHVKAGLKLLVTDLSSILIFSGSKTRPETENSEARSYLRLSQDNDYWGILASPGKEEKDGTLKDRIVLEEQALDSFGNILFSLVAFWRKTGAWPQKITIVSHDFKRARFLDLHVKALRWPRQKVEFVGIDPDYMIEGSPGFDRDRAGSVRRGEKERGYAAWEADLLGQGETLRRKRLVRNFWGADQALLASEEEREISRLRTKVVEFEWQGKVVKEEILAREMELPWEMYGSHIKSILK